MNKIQKLIYVTLRHEVVERISRELQVVISPEELLLGITENISLEKLAEIPLTYEQIRDMYASSNQINLSLRVLTALLHKSTSRRPDPNPGRTHATAPTGTVCGRPI